MPPAAGLAPWDLANAVTSFCTLGAGGVTLILTWLVRPQPRRWVMVYVFVVVTGVPTLGWHASLHEAWRVADTGSNIVLAYVMQLAALGDFYEPAFRKKYALAWAAVDLLALAWMTWEAFTGAVAFPLALGDFGGFNVGEVVLIANAFSVVGLIAARRDRIPDAARPILKALLITWLIGLGLASAAGETVHWTVFSWHALWHIVGLFGFIFLWAFNDIRFNLAHAEY